MTPSEPALNLALEHAARGFRVLPVFHIGPDGNCACPNGATCKSAGKHPSLKDWPNRATTDPDTIRAWWGRQPERNIGIATGMGSGVFVLDIDPGKGGDDSIWDLEASYSKLPPTWEAITPTGGAHKFFRAVSGIPSSTSDHNSLGAGLDIRGEGGQVVAAGSRRACGTYQWELSSHPDDIPLADAPEWLLALIFQGGAASKKHAGPATRDVLADWEQVKAGCPALAYAAGEGQASMGRPAWRHVVLNAVSFCGDPQRIAHEVSRNHPQYSQAETDSEITDALTKTHAPAKCKKIETAYGLSEFCKGCSHYNSRIGTPVMLGRPKIQVFHAGSSARSKPALPPGVPVQPEYPCYTELTSWEKAVPITGNRRAVLHAIASQSRRMGQGKWLAQISVEKINELRCSPKYDGLGEILESVYKPDYLPKAGCEVLQREGLCPAQSGVSTCPIYQIEQRTREAEVASISKDDSRFTISPLWVERTIPPIYYATVKAGKLKLSGDQLFEWRLFQKVHMTTPGIDEIPRLHTVEVEDGEDARGNPKMKKLPPQVVWAGVVNEALSGVIELPMPPENASPDGIAWEGFLKFIRDTRISENREDLKKGSILTESGLLYFRGPDVYAHLKMFGQDVLPPNQFWAMLRRRGADHGPIRAGDNVFKVWNIPSQSIEQNWQESQPEEVESALTR